MKKKIDGAILCAGNFDSGTGYAWRLIEKLWTVIATIGDENKIKTIACYPSITQINPSLCHAGIAVYDHDLFDNRLIGFFKSLRFIRSNHINYLYLTDRPVFSWYYLLYRLLGVKKIIVHDHTPGYRSPVVGLKKSVKKYMNRLSWVTADTVIGVSSYVCERLELVNCVPVKKIQCVTNGISDTLHVKNYNSNSSKIIRLVTVARVNSYKGIDFAIKVIQFLVEECGLMNIQYDVIGGGPELEAFKSLSISLNVDNYIRFLGEKSNVEELLPTYDIAFHPSKGEAMCLAIVEYMRAALPIITSTNLSVNSILENDEDSLFYSEFDVESAGNILANLISEETLREKLGLTARKNFITKYQEGKMLDDFRNLILKSLL